MKHPLAYAIAIAVAAYLAAIEAILGKTIRRRSARSSKSS
jgi:hypothetical protein